LATFAAGGLLTRSSILNVVASTTFFFCCCCCCSCCCCSCCCCSCCCCRCCCCCCCRCCCCSSCCCCFLCSAITFASFDIRPRCIRSVLTRILVGITGLRLTAELLGFDTLGILRMVAWSCTLLVCVGTGGGVGVAEVDSSSAVGRCSMSGGAGMDRSGLVLSLRSESDLLCFPSYASIRFLTLLM
jgi:hypothetical protein